MKLKQLNCKEMCMPNIFLKCLLTFMTDIFVNRPFLFKVVCLIEVSPKCMQGKTTKFIFSVNAVLAVRFN